MFLNQSTNCVAHAELNSLLNEVFSTGKQHYSPRTCLEDMMIQGESCHWHLVREDQKHWIHCTRRNWLLIPICHIILFNLPPPPPPPPISVTEQFRNFLYLCPSCSQTEANSQYGTESCKYDFYNCPWQYVSSRSLKIPDMLLFQLGYWKHQVLPAVRWTTQGLWLL